MDPVGVTALDLEEFENINEVRKTAIVPAPFIRLFNPDIWVGTSVVVLIVKTKSTKSQK